MSGSDNHPESEQAEASLPGVQDPAAGGLDHVLRRFEDMIDHCYDYAEAAKAEGRPIVGILCEFTPRELILAAGAVPVCLCGGSNETIPAAEKHLPNNLCPLIKSTYGYLVTGRNPFLNWADLVVAETTCDGKKKMFELMGRSKPLYLLDLPQRAEGDEALAAWTEQLRKLRRHLEAAFGVEIADDKLREAIRVMNRERRLRRGLAEHMQSPVPLLTGRQLLELKSIISGIPADLQAYETALAILQQNRPSAVSQTQKVRVLLTGVPLVHGAERVLELIENSGGLVVAMENCTGLKPILEDVDETDPDPIAALARKYLHLPCSVMLGNERRLDSLRSLTAKYRPECVVELVWQACLTYDVESFRVRELVEEELELPYLKITTDYSPSDSGRITARLDALMETVRARRGA